MSETATEPVVDRAEALARFFHDTYEELAPEHGYETREESRKPWADVPDQNKELMVAVADRVLNDFLRPRPHEDDNIYLIAGVARDGEAHVMIQWGAEVMQVPPDQVRVLAMNALETAEAAEAESLLYRWLQADGTMDSEKAAKLLYSFRSFRTADTMQPAEPDPPVVS